MKRRGTVIDFNTQRGFGFIAPDSGTGNLFFHVSAIAGARDGIAAGEAVRYEIGLDGKGRFEAKRVWRSAGRSIETGILAALTPGLWFIAGIAVLAALGRTSYWMAVYYGAMSVLSYTAYAGDKRRAVSGGRRTPENILHLLDLLGGWPGGILAQQAKRHKRRKSGFMAITALIVCAHVLGWTWLAVSGRTLFLTLHDRSLSQPIEQIGEDWWVR